MMMNMFSMFDPSSSIMKMNWLMLFSPLLLMVFSKKNKFLIILSSLMIAIKKEINPILVNSKKSSEIILINLLLMIIILNLISLTPFTFTINTQIITTFPLAFSMWFTMMIFGWLKASKSMIKHSLPSGTPTVLINFMILIELTSNLIRPMTLTIRLSANMMAGHLLMNLLGSMSSPSMFPLVSVSLIMILLSFLELAVSFIQGYVFMMLITLYSKEMI